MDSGLYNSGRKEEKRGRYPYFTNLVYSAFCSLPLVANSLSQHIAIITSYIVHSVPFVALLFK